MIASAVQLASVLSREIKTFYLLLLAQLFFSTYIYLYLDEGRALVLHRVVYIHEVRGGLSVFYTRSFRDWNAAPGHDYNWTTEL